MSFVISKSKSLILVWKTSCLLWLNLQIKILQSYLDGDCCSREKISPFENKTTDNQWQHVIKSEPNPSNFSMTINVLCVSSQVSYLRSSVFTRMWISSKSICSLKWLHPLECAKGHWRFWKLKVWLCRIWGHLLVSLFHTGIHTTGIQQLSLCVEVIWDKSVLSDFR